MSDRDCAIIEFRRHRMTWLRIAREHREAGARALYLHAVEGARIAQANLLHVLRRVPA
jgi:hypothetical protein